MNKTFTVRNKITGEIFQVTEHQDIRDGHTFYRRVPDGEICEMEELEPASQFDSQQFKAQIMATMLPILYNELPNEGHLVRDKKKQAVEAAAEIAEMAERRLNNG